MDVHVITETGVRDAGVADLPTLLQRDDGVVWVDVPVWDADAERVLTEVFGLHPLAVRDCAGRNRLPKVHAYPDVLLLVLHAPEVGPGGAVHQVELDRVVGPNYLITVHGPTDPDVDPGSPLRDTREVLERIRAGRLHPRTPFDVSHAIVSTMTRRMERFIEALATEVDVLERRVADGPHTNPEPFLDELFRTRHALLAVTTTAKQTAEIYRRVERLSTTHMPASSRPLVGDLVDQFDRLSGLASEEKEYLQGVIEFYRTRADTKMTIAAERLAVIAVVTLPITALTSIFGMNFIVNTHTRPIELTISLVVMLAGSIWLVAWAKRQGWW
ncbi:MAG: magnesium transporter CorA family protein [Promicromonosporaceae bacterium]|nr:magnesium transporter CorA family protein [Promicromonosporaceae bacterium]